MNLLTKDGRSIVWDSVFQSQLAALADRTGVRPEHFRTAGRKTNTNPDGETIDWWRIDGLRQVEEYVKWLETTGWEIAVMPDGKPAIEWMAEVWFGGRPVRLVIDAIYSNGSDLIAVDYKTGSQPPAGVMQLAFYASAIERVYGSEWRPKWGSYYMSRKGQLSGLVDLSHWDMAFFDHAFEAMNAQMDLGYYPPNVDKHCSFCSVADYCTAVNGPKSSEYPLQMKGK